MAFKPQGLIALLFPVVFFVVLIAAFVGECDSGNGQSGGTLNYPKISRDEAVNKLDQMVKRILPQERYVQSREMILTDKKADLADTLPDVSLMDKHFPLTVNPYQTGSDDIVLEVFCSTEKSGTKEPDNWFTKVATDFNEQGIKLANGKTVKVKVRYIASGTAYFYIASKKYLPDAFSPSNHLWIKMVEDSQVRVTPFSERLVGNTAGIVMRDATYDKLMKDYNKVDIKAVIDAVAQGSISMGYTDPFASSTGLNFLVTVLATYANFDESKLLSPEVIKSFEAFQKGVPYVAFTTIQMRESVQRGGMLDAFVLEYQTFLNEPSLSRGFKFIPFGVRHDNPLYGIGDLSAEKAEALTALARYAESRSSLADQFKFNQDNTYQSAFAIPAGKALVEAQSLWKEKKNSGRPLAAVFLSDVSGSMNGYPLKNLKIALKEGAGFINSMNAIGLVQYSTDVKKILSISPFNALQQSRYLAAVNEMGVEEDTSMFDGITVALAMLVDFVKNNPEYKPILFVLTDGNTNAGVFQRFDDIVSIVDALDIPVYTIAYGEKVNSKLLKDISSINEAASMDAKDEAIINKIGSLLNAEM
jgi:Ca-activated chloride channel family protein